jgi:hypothetical protein
VCDAVSILSVKLRNPGPSPDLNHALPNNILGVRELTPGQDEVITGFKWKARIHLIPAWNKIMLGLKPELPNKA